MPTIVQRNVRTRTVLMMSCRHGTIEGHVITEECQFLGLNVKQVESMHTTKGLMITQ